MEATGAAADCAGRCTFLACGLSLLTGSTGQKSEKNFAGRLVFDEAGQHMQGGGLMLADMCL